MTLSHNELVENISDVLREVEGDYLARIYNQICSDKVVYKGDSLFERLEDPDIRRESLEDVGYQISEDSDQPGFWLWATPSDGSEVSFHSREEAEANAWEDAAQQVQSILAGDPLALSWASLSTAKQAELIVTLLGNSES